MTVPIYAHSLGGKTRYTIAFYRDGKRRRRCFTELTRAKKEAKAIAEKIVRGMQAQNDLNPAEREAYLAAQRIFSEGRIFISKAVILLCLAKKSRDADHLRNLVYHRQAGLDDEGSLLGGKGNALVLENKQFSTCEVGECGSDNEACAGDEVRCVE